jgi:hypothetical protein
VPRHMPIWQTMEPAGSPSKNKVNDRADSSCPVTPPPSALSSIRPPIASTCTSSPGAAAGGSILERDGGTATGVRPGREDPGVAVGAGIWVAAGGAAGDAVSVGAVSGTGVAVGAGAVGGAGAEVPATVGNGADVAAAPPHATKNSSNTGQTNDFFREIAAPMVLLVQRNATSHGIAGYSAFRLLA